MVTRIDRARRGNSGAASHRYGWLFLIAGALALLVQPGSPIQAQASGARYEGVATCAGSTCHGRAEGNGEVVRQDEIATWQEPSSAAGAHSRAYAVLASPRGKQIASRLGLGAATSASACLGCHATYEPGSPKGERFQISDGVGCESCHGAASPWLASHYTKLSSTHTANVANGLTPLDRPQTRAKVCLDCHYGGAGAGQFVTHAMMAAGHPRVSFELDLFSALQQHHDEDADYTARKGKTDNVRLWAVGQAEAVVRSTDLFARPNFATRGAFPEFYFYDCHSCHRPINDGPVAGTTFEDNPGRPVASPREERFGLPPYNDENIIMLSAIARAFVPGRAAQFEAASKDFHKAMGTGRAEAAAAAQRLRGEAAALSDALAGRQFSGVDAFAAVQAIADRTLTARFTDYSGSAQAVMAVDTLLNAMVRDGRITTGAATGIRANINRAYNAVRSPESFEPAKFRSALGQATSAIGALR